jgi:hypothetical protein
MHGASSQWLQRITEKWRPTFRHVVLALAGNRAGVAADAGLTVEEESESRHQICTIVAGPQRSSRPRIAPDPWDSRARAE